MMGWFGGARWTFRTYIGILCAFYLLLVLVFHSQLQFKRLEILSEEEERQLQLNLEGTDGRQSMIQKLKQPPPTIGHILKNIIPKEHLDAVPQGLNNHTVVDTQKVNAHKLLKDKIDDSIYVASGNGQLTPGCAGTKVQGNIFHDINEEQLIYPYSSYWDIRYNDFDNKINGTYIRIMTIVKIREKPELQCHFIVDGRSVEVTATYYEMCENHNMLYGGHILSCRVPELLQTAPCSIKVSLKSAPRAPVHLPVWSLQPKSDQLDYGICVPPLFGSLNEHSLVEFIEMSKLLGVQKVTFYDFQLNPNTRHILKHFVVQGDAAIVPWHLPPLLDGQMWYHGQLVAIQDCLYRNMHRFKFLSFNDIDEYIVPHVAGGEATWKEMTEVLHTPNRCGYQFKSAYFDRSDRTVNSTYDRFVTLYQNQRTAQFSKVRTKCMVEPYKIFEKGIHHISKPILADLETVPVDTETGFLHHYRPCVGNYGMSCSSYVKDVSMHKFDTQLYRSVSETLEKLKGLIRPF